MDETTNGSIMEPISLSDNEEAMMEEIKIAEEDEPKAEESAQDVGQRLLQMEQERGQLAAEVMSKDSLIAKLEKEAISLKSELTLMESSNAAVKAEQDRKFLQMHEEMTAKVAEVLNGTNIGCFNLSSNSVFVSS